MPEPTDKGYVFDATRDQPELERLRVIESVFDPATLRRLEATGVTAGWRCLEVGPGAGSVMGWLSRTAGSTGHVTAVDINPRFIGRDLPANVELRQADIREFEPATGRYDLVHARFVLIHLADYLPALDRMVAALRPGGWIVLEEPDFSAARPVSGPPELCEAVERVNRAVRAMFAQRGMDHAFGLRLPAELARRGFDSLHVENEALIVPGGAGTARVMRMSTEALREVYVSTGEATDADVDAYCRFADDPGTWAIYQGTVAVTGQAAGAA